VAEDEGRDQPDVSHVVMNGPGSADELPNAYRIKKAGGVAKLKAELASRGDAMEQ
jgi:hypothetical protein